MSGQFWENDRPVAAPTPAPAPRSSGPRVLVPDVNAGAEADARAQAQAVEIQRLRLAQESNNRDNERLRAEQEDRDRRLAAGPAADARESEASNGAYLRRAESALQNYESLAGQLGGPRSTAGGIIASLPFGVGESILRALPDSVGDSPERRAAERAARDFVTTILRSDSGANAPEPEVDRAISIYFPPAGETDPAVLAQYATARRQAIEGLRLKAGRMASTAEAGQEQGNAAIGLPPVTGNRSEVPGAAPNGPPPPPPAIRIGRVAGSGGGTQNQFGTEDAGTGFRLVPELNGLGSEVPAMIEAGYGVDQIMQRIADRYAAIGSVPTDAHRQFIEGVVAEKQRTNLPAAALANNWRTLEMMQGGDAQPTLLGQAADSTVGAALMGVADVGTMGFLDEGIGAINSATGIGPNTENARAVMDYAQAERPISYTAGQILAGLALPTGTEGLALREGTAALRAGRTLAEARTIAANAVRTRMAGEGAAYGAAYGAGSADGTLSDRAIGAAIGGVAGGAGGFAGGTLAGRMAGRSNANRVAGRAAPAGTGPSEYLDAASRQQITPFVADAGGPATRRVVAGLEQTMAGAGPIRRAADATLSTAEAARDRVARAIGPVLTSREAVGTTVATAAQREIKRMNFEAGEGYNRARRMAGETVVRPSRAYDTLTGHIEDLADTGLAQTGLGVLQRLQGRMEQGPISIQTLRNMRTALRDDLTETGLRGSDISRRANEVLDSISTDIEQTLVNAGKSDAAQEFARADRAWAEMNELAEQVIEPIIGSERQALSGEQVVQNLSRALEGNSVRAVRFLNSLPDDARNTARASIVARLGRASNGGQNAAGDEFSLSTFLTNWNAIPDERVRLALFGREGRAALNDLATVAEQSRNAQRYRNTSNTAGAMPNPPTLGDILTGGARYWGPNVTARMLTNPRFVRWFAAGIKKPNPQAERAHIQRLTAVARSEPVLAQAILDFQQQLLAPVSRAPVAANNPDNVGQGVMIQDTGGERGNQQ